MEMGSRRGQQAFLRAEEPLILSDTSQHVASVADSACIRRGAPASPSPWDPQSETHNRNVFKQRAATSVAVEEFPVNARGGSVALVSAAVALVSVAVAVPQCSAHADTVVLRMSPAVWRPYPRVTGARVGGPNLPVSLPPPCAFNVYVNNNEGC
ncbi:hypothetical protein AGOR_G00129080 [Albula goreensis]|uniref:Uncharacterized protein n=1 Tax=Albula goreensis TaxID=1534307 RepID=A0A8T3DDT2_9TELE|nr:hypothetical protein AGOR_G00129080 [Albula goreensis]